MRVSASIVTYNTDPVELCKCLKCLVANDVTDVWIIDNSPVAIDINRIVADGRMSEKLSVRYKHLSNNPGYGAAHNHAIHDIINEGFDAHLVINSDIIFNQGVIEELTKYLASDNRVGQISPRIISPDGQPQYAQRLLPTPLDVFGRRFLPAFMMRRRNRRYLLTARHETEPANIPYHQGSFMLFRVDALKDVGGFDERFFMYPEDIDITRRIHRNWVTAYYPHVDVTHAHRAASYKNKKMLWIHCHNMIKYFNKWGWFIDRERRAINRATLASMHLDNPTASPSAGRQ